MNERGSKLISFPEWNNTRKDTRPWLVIGKGPSFSKYSQTSHLSRDYNTMGLNHVCREKGVLVTHVIDVNVLDEIPGIENLTSYLVMPMHPHYNFKPTKTTLIDLMETNPVIRSFSNRNALLWYNLGNWPYPHLGAPVIKVAYFSAEAAIRLLAVCGVRKIRTLGVDGGNEYASAFNDMKPFRGGHTTFNLQNEPIMNTVKEFNLNFSALNQDAQ